MKATTIERLAPGLGMFRNYRREWLSSDLLAGVSVAAVSLPIGIAYAQLAGFPPVVGIYSCILPPVAYALFGSSRQLIVNPDAAACAIVASTVTPLALGDPTRYLDLAIVLTLMTGVFCILGGLAGLGVIANFLSRPILTGYLNGIALSIIVGQIGLLLGFQIPHGGFFLTLWRAISHISQTHTPTAIVGVSLLALMLIMKKFLKGVPAPLVAAVVGIGAVYFLALTSRGVATVGSVPAGFPEPRIPSVALGDLVHLGYGAAGIMLVSFCSMMTTARGFAAKNGYTIDVNRDMSALGACDLAAGLSSGFVVSGADSRTAVADSSGGKSQMTSIVAAIAMALVLLFFTGPLAYVPTTALAAILISSASGLFDFASMRRYYELSKPEFYQCVIATLGVMTIGVLPGVLIAVTLAMLNLLARASKPNNVVLGVIEGQKHVYAVEGEGGTSLPGLIIYRFDAALVFFNADFMKGRVDSVLADATTPPTYFLFNAEACPMLDVSGAEALGSIHTKLRELGIGFGISRANGFFRAMLERSGVADEIGEENLFGTVHAGVKAFRAKEGRSKAGEDA